MRNQVVQLLGCALVASMAGCSTTQTRRVIRIDASLTKAAKYIVAKQSPNGIWRSETYGCFRDDPALTAYVLSGLFFLPQGGEQARASFHKGVEYLVKMVDEDGNIRTGPRGLNFPVYTAASASRVVVLEKKTKEHLRAQAAWLSYLRRRQLNESLGWKPSDPEYGGWGFSLRIPHKPAAGELKEAFFESNLSATTFGIGALRSAGIPREDPVWKNVLVFVKKCQNFSDDPAKSDPRFDDGGFFFITNDPLQNKAGIAGRDRFGRERYHSYGSMTGDGVRALLQCGLLPNHPRVLAARKWLEKNFTVETHPGTFAEDREVLREATYYYYLWSAAHAFTRLGITEVETKAGKAKWAEAIADELIRRQRPDGSWVNRFTDAKEDDPLVSTPWAAAALANCREVITAHGKLPRFDLCRGKTPTR
ncbi:MAG: prenyltransferase/squalene oxidase repeat-containing protein [Planctomycetota bacterium]